MKIAIGIFLTHFPPTDFRMICCETPSSLAHNYSRQSRSITLNINKFRMPATAVNFAKTSEYLLWSLLHTSLQSSARILVGFALVDSTRIQHFLKIQKNVTMTSYAARFATRVALPVASTLLSQSFASKCEELPLVDSLKTHEHHQEGNERFANTQGFRADSEGDFHHLFPRRQLWQPAVEYPLWDGNWDGRQPAPLEDPDEERRRTRMIRKEGVTRHIILIRHGQYDEGHRVCQLCFY